MTSVLALALETTPLGQRALSFWRSSRLTRSVAALAGGSALAQALSLITAPITARLYSPDDYGTAAVFNALVGFLCTVASYKYEMAIMLPDHEEQSRDVLTACVVLSVFTSVVLGIFTWWCGDWAFGRLGAPILHRYWWLLPIGVLGSALYQSFYYWTLRPKNYVVLAKTRLQQAVGGALVTIGTGCISKGPLGLLLGTCFSLTLGIGRLSRSSLIKKSMAAQLCAPHRIVDTLRSYGGFAFLTTSASLLNSTGLLLPPILFSALYGQQTAGSFSLAQRVVLLPGNLVGAAMAQVFLSEAAEILRERPSELRPFFTLVTRRMAPLALGLLIVGAVCPWAFPLAFGARWKTAGLFAAFLALSCAAQLVVSPVANISILRKRQDLQLMLDALRAFLVLGAIILPAVCGWGALVAVGCYALGMTVMYALYYVLYRHLA
jgi:O-antigen/teichoic acid export membrane protein